VDVMEEGRYVGGFLLPGLKSYIDAYAIISPALATTFNRDISLEALPKDTRDGISFGIIGSIKSLIEKYQSHKKLYISGGDGRFLSTYFENVEFDETLIFQGMKNVLKGKNNV